MNLLFDQLLVYPERCKLEELSFYIITQSTITELFVEWLNPSVGFASTRPRTCGPPYWVPSRNRYRIFSNFTGEAYTAFRRLHFGPTQKIHLVHWAMPRMSHNSFIVLLAFSDSLACNARWFQLMKKNWRLGNVISLEFCVSAKFIAMINTDEICCEVCKFSLLVLLFEVATIFHY